MGGSSITDRAKGSSSMEAAPRTRSQLPERAAGRARKKRRFYIVYPKVTGRGLGYRLLNADTLLVDGAAIITPLPGRRGFRNYPETPVFLADPKDGPIDWDFRTYSAYWLISDAMKAVLESVDPAAFAFLKCKSQLPDGSQGPALWLCDVVRVLDALDEERSRVRIETASDGSKYYGLAGGPSFVFKEDIVGSAHVFRLKHAEDLVICDEEMRLACKQAELTGISFEHPEKR
jgi:hypothetical protein